MQCFFTAKRIRLSDSKHLHIDLVGIMNSHNKLLESGNMCAERCNLSQYILQQELQTAFH